MNKRSAAKILSFSILASLLPAIAMAGIGVGVGVGKIKVGEYLKPGGIYDLPSVPVLNTGDTASDYGIGVEYREHQEEKAEEGMRPPVKWFNFTPDTFRLEPGQVQLVKVTLTVPTKDVKPGQYFAFLSAHPVSAPTSGGGNSSVGVAAAVKLWFTVAPANFFEAVYYRFIAVYVRYHPWDTIVLSVLAGLAALWLLSRKIKLQVAIK